MGEFLGQRAEREAIDKLLTGARAGASGSMVVHGEAGIGKTALLEHARGAADALGFRVESSIGVESESQFAFAGLHLLCAPLLERAHTLPDPQQAALGVALGQRDGAAPDRFMVGLATLNLLAEVAEDRPLLCLIDDAQWLDEASAQVLAFVARRLAAERIALVFAKRDPSPDYPGDEGTALAGLPELRMQSLGESDSRALLVSALAAPLDDLVIERIVAESFGNPMALLELPLSAQSAQLAGGFDLPGALDVPRRVEESFRRRSSNLPSDTQLLLLVAAAEPTGDVALLSRAAAELGLPESAVGPAEAAGLLEIGNRVRFRHPLVRSAVYRDATPPDKRRVHDALAAATDPHTDPDRRAWHRAQAVLGTDEDAAAELERSADRARARGGSAAAAAFLHHATRLTGEPARRVARALEAARANYEAGSSDAALELLTVAAAGPVDAVQRASIELLRAQIAFHLKRASAAPGMFLDAARTLVPLNAALARETYLHALDAAVITGGREVGQIAEAAMKGPPSGVPARAVDLLLDGLAKTLTGGYATGAPAMRHALESFHDNPILDPEQDRWLRLAGRNAVVILDEDLLFMLASRNVRLGREAGALAVLPDALRFLSITSVLMGELARADELASEATAVTRATGGVELQHAHVILRAWRGDPSVVSPHSGITLSGVADLDRGADAALTQYAMAVLHNGLGNYAAAQDAAGRAYASHELSLSSAALPLPEFIEACVRAGQPDRALEELDELSSRARISGTPWALGLAARSRALMSFGSAAENLYKEAVEQLSCSRMVPQLARTHLVYGEWLRREGRRQDAREQLRIAHGLLSDMGAEAFAMRAARELQATGEHPRKRTAQPTDELTPHERHIARLVATGATSREVGEQLFLSPRTIEAHLRNIFRKLDITSRRQLREVSLP